MMMMDDIPETGAVFTLGKSYLSDNHQSYFFIKNDPVKILISGANQSGVICESGRLFVWGENQCGQLGIGSNEIVTKPSCVKAIKNLGYKIRNAAFGDGFSVILTENNKIYFTGKNIFPENSIINREKFNHQHQIFIRKPFEVFEFDECRRLDVEQHLEEFVDLSAGQQHFVILSSNGNIFGWGTNQQNQIGPNTVYNQPTQINDNNTKVRVICCGKTSTVFITETNELFIIGLIERKHFVKLQKINTESYFNDLIYSLYVSINDEILLLTSDREIYKHKLNDGASEIIFEQLDIFINDNEIPRKISAGNGFISIVTENNTFITTFNDKLSSATTTDSENNVIVDHSSLNHQPRQLKKFRNLEIIDIVSGLNHILVHAVPLDKNNPILSSSEDITVSENLAPYLISNKSIPTKFNQQSSPRNILDESQKQLPTFTISDANNNNDLNQENFTQSFDIENEKYFIETTKKNNNPIEFSEDLLNNNNIINDLEKSISLNEFEHLENEIQQNENDIEVNSKKKEIESLTENNNDQINSNDLDIKDPILKQLYDNQLNTFSTSSLPTSTNSPSTVKSKTEQQNKKLSYQKTDTDTDPSKMNTTINSIVDSVETKTVNAADKITNALTSTFSNNIKQPIQNLMGTSSPTNDKPSPDGDHLPKSSFIDEHIKKPIGSKLDEGEVLLKSEIQNLKNTAIKDFHELKTKIGLENGDDVKKNSHKNAITNDDDVDPIDDESKDEKLKIIINEKNGKQTASLKRTNADGHDDDDDDDDDKNSLENEIDNMVTFIDNGVDVTEHTVKHLVQECDELEHSVKEDVKELKRDVIETGHKIEDSLLGEKLQNTTTESVRKFKDVKEETKDALKMVVEDVIEPVDIRNMIKTPATLATTAVTVPIHNSMRMNYIEDNTKNPFNKRGDDDDDIDKISQITTSMHDKKSNGGGGRVKKFFKELKDFTCQNVNPQATIDDHDPPGRNNPHQQQQHTEYNVNDNDGKVSRYCTIS